MTLDVLDEITLARLGRIEVWVSLYWDEPYNTGGEVTLEVRPTEENLALLREGRWLKRSDSDVPMRICHRSNENQDSNLVVTGAPGTWIFTKRAATEIIKNENAEAEADRKQAEQEALPQRVADLEAENTRLKEQLDVQESSMTDLQLALCSLYEAADGGETE